MQVREQNNVTPMRDYRLQDDIQSWFNRLSEESSNTRTNYERSVRFFFEVLLNKSLEHLTLTDIQIRRVDLDNFVTKMSNMKKARGEGTYSTTTVNQTVDRVSAFYKYLATNEYPVNPAIFHKAGRKERDAEKHPILTWEQVERIMDIVRGYDENGETFALLIETAVKTCFRKEALLSLTLQNFKRLNENLWIAKVYDKGEWNEKPVKRGLYERLVEHHHKTQDPTGRLFTVSSDQVQTMVERVRKDAGFHFVFHSFKKAGMLEVSNITGGDIKAIQEMGNHKDATTPIEYYMEFNKDWENHPALQIGEALDLSVFDSLDKVQLLELIKKSERAIQMRLLNTLKNN